MKEENDILKLRIMLIFLKGTKENCTVTGISRTLGVPKQKTSRIIIELEKEGIIDRSNTRNPVLTEKGRYEAEKYAGRITDSLNHLLFEGVGMESAQEDAYRWALYNTDETMKVIKSTAARYRAKYELRDLKHFSGTTLCRKLDDGIYHFHFVMYRENVKDGNNISMANEGFEHPCSLIVKNGIGKVQLHAIPIYMRMPMDGAEISGKVESLKYFDSGDFVSAEMNNDIINIPASALSFVNIGEDINQVMHGSVCFRIKCTAAEMYMPESVAIFNMLI